MTAYETLWRSLVEAEMRYRGYTDDEIAKAREPNHADLCDFDGGSYGWICTDENGDSNHPVADEYGEVCDVIGRVLEALDEKLRFRVSALLR